MAVRRTDDTTRRRSSTGRTASADRRRGDSQQRRRRTGTGDRTRSRTSDSRTRKTAGGDVARERRAPARNRAVDGFRALAIIAVVLYHLDVPWLPSGHLGVGMFLVLTGYLVTSSLIKRMREGLSSIPRFWIGRLARIWPPMALMIAFTILTCVIGNHVLLTKARPDVLPGLALFENVSYIMRNVSYFEQIGGPSPLTHLWYLGIDAQFCLIWPIVMALFSLLPSRAAARRITLILAVASAVAMAVLYNPDAGITRVYYGLDTRLFAPLLGAWLAYVVPLGRKPARDVRPLIQSLRLVIEMVAIVSLALLVIAMVLVPDTSLLLYRGGMFVAALLSMVVLFAIVLPGGLISAGLALPPLTWLGSRSFGIYLWHFPLIQLFRASSNGTPWYMVALTVVLSLVLGELTYRLIEQPVSRLVSGKGSQDDRQPQREGGFNPVAIAWVAALGLVLVTDGVGLALIEDETLVPEEAIVSTGDDAGHAMDLSEGKPNSNVQEADIPAADAVLHAPASEKEQGIYDPVLIGDSVPGDAEAYWIAAFPDGLMDSYVGRRPDQAVTVLDEYLAQGVVGKIVILQAFSNMPPTPEELDHMIQACGPDRIVYVVNVRIPESEETIINQRLAEAVNRYDNAHLINWYALSEGQGDWIYPDGEHLTPTGQPIYINMLVDAITQDFTDAGGTITSRTTGSADGTVDTGTTVVVDPTADASASYDDGSYTDESETDSESEYTDESDGYSDEQAGMAIDDAVNTSETLGSDGTAPTQEASMRILMLGNSFTYYNDMPTMLADLTDAEVVTHARGKGVLSDQLSEDDNMGALTLAALDQGGWDYVVLQEMSSRPIRKHQDEYYQSVSELADKARACGATPVIFATWPYNEGASRLEKLGITREEMTDQLHAAFVKAADKSGALMADVEDAFVSFDSQELLYAQDGVHPSSIGSRLAAEVIAETIEKDQAQKGKA